MPCKLIQYSLVVGELLITELSLLRTEAEDFTFLVWEFRYLCLLLCNGRDFRSIVVMPL